MSSATRTPPSYEVTCQHYQVMARRLMKDVRHPYGDFCVTLFVEEEVGSEVVPIDPDIIQSRADKEHFFTVVLPEMLRRARVRMFGLAMPAWWVPPDKLNEREEALIDEIWRAGAKLVDHPKRKEIACLTVCDGDRQDTYLADVKRRSGQRPLYGPWVHIDTETERRLCDLMVDDLRTALQAVRAEMREDNDD